MTTCRCVSGYACHLANGKTVYPLSNVFIRITPPQSLFLLEIFIKGSFCSFYTVLTHNDCLQPQRLISQFNTFAITSAADAQLEALSQKETGLHPIGWFGKELDHDLLGKMWFD